MMQYTEAVARWKSLCGSRSIDSTMVSLLVEKGRRRLRILLGEQCLAELPVIVGRNGLGHKQREGDERTPEGEYTICYRNDESRFHLFLGLSYPNADDAAAALARGDLDEAGYRSIVEPLAAGGVPNWYTGLGGEIGLHGGGIGRSGTAGCVAMADGDIELLWVATCLGCRVQIRA